MILNTCQGARSFLSFPLFLLSCNCSVELHRDAKTAVAASHFMWGGGAIVPGMTEGSRWLHDGGQGSDVPHWSIVSGDRKMEAASAPARRPTESGRFEVCAESFRRAFGFVGLSKYFSDSLNLLEYFQFSFTSKFTGIVGSKDKWTQIGTDRVRLVSLGIYVLQKIVTL